MPHDGRLILGWVASLCPASLYNGPAVIGTTLAPELGERADRVVDMHSRLEPSGDAAGLHGENLPIKHLGSSRVRSVSGIILTDVVSHDL